MKRHWLITMIVGLSLVWVAYTSCSRPILINQKSGLGGSVAGNPMTGATKVLEAMCSVISRCRPEVSMNQCKSGILATGGFDTELGLPPGSYNTYSTLERTEQANFISADSFALNSCTTDIAQLTCADPKVQSAYDSSLANPFLQAAAMIPNSPGSCPSLYSPKAKAFPSAEGFGQNTQGGRGGRAIYVNNLNDSGPGSLREALTASGPRIVVFEISGTIDLQSNIVLSGEAMSFLTVAGQTSPGGIQTKGPFGILISDGAHDLVFRFLRIRPGGPMVAGQGSAIQINASAQQSYNVVVDHCSMEWYGSANGINGDARDVTFQWNIMANGLTGSWTGLAVIGRGNLQNPLTATFHHNLIASNEIQNPYVQNSGVIDFRNNLIFNWGSNNGAVWGSFRNDQSAFGNNINNQYLAGPGSSTIYLWLGNGGPTRIDGSSADRGGTKIYTEGTWGLHCPAGCQDDWLNEFYVIDYFEAGQSPSPLATQGQFGANIPFPAPPVGTDPTASLQNKVLATVGAFKPSRDAADISVVNDVVNSTGSFPAQGGPWPMLTGGPIAADTDRDGIPDAWESANGLNPADPTDGAAIAPNGYSYVENYLNQLAGDL